MKTIIERDHNFTTLTKFKGVRRSKPRNMLTCVADIHNRRNYLQTTLMFVDAMMEISAMRWSPRLQSQSRQCVEVSEARSRLVFVLVDGSTKRLPK